MEESYMLIPSFDNPVPGLHVDVVMCKLIETINVPEVIYHHQDIIAASLASPPRRQAQHAILVSSRDHLIIARGEVVRGLLRTRCEHAQWVLKVTPKWKTTIGCAARWLPNGPVCIEGSCALAPPGMTLSM